MLLGCGWWFWGNWGIPIGKAKSWKSAVATKALEQEPIRLEFLEEALVA